MFLVTLPFIWEEDLAVAFSRMVIRTKTLPQLAELAGSVIEDAFDFVTTRLGNILNSMKLLKDIPAETALSSLKTFAEGAIDSIAEASESMDGVMKLVFDLIPESSIPLKSMLSAFSSIATKIIGDALSSDDDTYTSIYLNRYKRYGRK